MQLRQKLSLVCQQFAIFGRDDLLWMQDGSPQDHKAHAENEDAQEAYVDINTRRSQPASPSKQVIFILRDGNTRCRSDLATDGTPSLFSQAANVAEVVIRSAANESNDRRDFDPWRAFSKRVTVFFQ